MRRLEIAALAALLAVAAILLLSFPAGCLSTSVTSGETQNREQSQDQPAPDLAMTLESHIQDIKNNAGNLASLIHDMINEKRKEDGLKPLQWDRQLAEIALGHSEDMAERDYFDHVSPDGEDFTDRYADHGYTLKTVIGDTVYAGGENLFLNNVVESYEYEQDTGEIFDYNYNTVEDLARSTVEGWMESPGHRENILTPFTREGIGVVVSGDGKVYITENFS